MEKSELKKRVINFMLDGLESKPIMEDDDDIGQEIVNKTLTRAEIDDVIEEIHTEVRKFYDIDAN